MASLKAIRRRIASTRSTQQITRAMKLVAAARLRRAQDALLAARPYGDALTRVADSVLGSQEIAPAEGATRDALIVVVGADRGLCGSYNTNLLNFADEVADRLRGESVSARFFAVGRKIREHYKRVDAPVAGERIENRPRLATIALARDLAARLLADFRSGDVVEAGVVFSRFHSPIVQRPTYQQLLPISAGDGRAPDSAPADYLFEPGRDQLVPVVLRTYLEMSVFRALLEGEASEQGARMTAMDNATNNAQDMIERLTLDMNRARQAQITRELMDIVGGAEALRA
jgi:F-type H+-transporting ATPase subunit gamma